MLPIPADRVYSQHAALGAAGALVRPSFSWRDPAKVDPAVQVARRRERIAYRQQCSATPLDAAGRSSRERATACPVR